MKNKILITDYDGTLALPDGTVSQHTCEVIKEFVAHGGTFIICTGRMKTSILPIARSITGNGYVISFNGAEISKIDTGEDVAYTPIDNKTTLQALSLILDTGAYVQSYYDGKIIIDKRGEFTSFYEDIGGVKATEVYEDLYDHYKRTGRDSAKLLVFDKPEKVDYTFEKIYPVLKDKLKVVRSNPYHIEITEKTVSKGNAVKKLLKSMGKALDENVITIGDSGNDISMLEGFPASFAVANALDEAKNKAKTVLPVSNQEGAIDYVIEHYCK